MDVSRRSFMRRVAGAGSMLVADIPRPPGDIYSGVLANWCGGAFIADHSPRGGVGYHGGGEHHSWPGKGGVLMLNCSTRRYEMRCVPAIRTHMDRRIVQ